MNENQLLLINKAQESLKAAEILLKEKLYAFSVSRAYYSMFYVAEVFLLENDLNFSKHSAVISAFGQNYAKTGKVPTKFHKYLIKWEIVRTRADYDTHTVTTEEEAQEAIINAKEFIDFAKEYFKNDNSNS